MALHTLALPQFDALEFDSGDVAAAVTFVSDKNPSLSIISADSLTLLALSEDFGVHYTAIPVVDGQYLLAMKSTSESSLTWDLGVLFQGMEGEQLGGVAVVSAADVAALFSD